MINALIIDDEPHCIVTLQHDLNVHCPEINVLACCHSAKEGMLAIREHLPDLVFLDIGMPGINGFEMLEMLGNDRHFSVIFTTAHDDFVLKAIRINALDYLLKPVDGKELKQAVERAAKTLGQRQHQHGQIDNLLSQLGLPEEQRRIALPNRSGYEFVNADDICYCKADGAYTLLKFKDGKEILLSKALGEMEDMLPPLLFERVHHSALVNINEIKHINKNDGFGVIMANGDRLNVARSKKDHLLTRMGIR